MSAPPTPHGHTEAAIDREIRLLLIRHLPANLHGIGIAQSRALSEMLHRRSAHDYKVVIDDDFRRGMAVLANLVATHPHCPARGHHVSPGCEHCPEDTNEGCPLIRAATLMGLTSSAPSASPEDTGRP